MELNGVSSIPENASKFHSSLYLNYMGLFVADRFQLMTENTIFWFIWDFLELPQNSTKTRVPLGLKKFRMTELEPWRDFLGYSRSF